MAKASYLNNFELVFLKLYDSSWRHIYTYYSLLSNHNPFPKIIENWKFNTMDFEFAWVFS